MNVLRKIYDWWSPPPFPIQALPNDLFGEFILCLDPIVLGKLMQTSSQVCQRICRHHVWQTRFRQQFPLRFVPSTLKECRQALVKHWLCTQVSGTKFWHSDKCYIQFEYDQEKIKHPVEIGGPNQRNSRKWIRNAWKLRRQPSDHWWIVVDFENVAGVYFPLVYEEKQSGASLYEEKQSGASLYERGKLSVRGLHQISSILEK